MQVLLPWLAPRGLRLLLPAERRLERRIQGLDAVVVGRPGRAVVAGDAEGVGLVDVPDARGVLRCLLVVPLLLLLHVRGIGRVPHPIPVLAVRAAQVDPVRRL